MKNQIRNNHSFINTPSIQLRGIIVLMILSMACSVFAEDSKPSPRTQFRSYELWPDNNGVHINAHGGGILFHEGTYYWYGAHMIKGLAGKKAHVGVRVYSSKDLYNWKDEGVALPVSHNPQDDLIEGCIIERPKVIYNALTKKFVMWFHFEPKDGDRYKAALTAVAVADKATGPFTYVQSLRPHAGVWPINVTDQDKIDNGSKQTALARDFEVGQMSRDMTLFVDDDGKAYHITSSEDNKTLQISELSPDFQSFSKNYARVLVGGKNEAPAICKHNGRYWMLASGISGWHPNAAQTAVADNIFGPWKALGNPCVGENPYNNLGPKKTFGGQSTFILPVNGKKDAYIAMFDVWRPDNSIDGRYVWLPLQFNEEGLKIEWMDPWDLSYFDKK